MVPNKMIKNTVLTGCLLISLASVALGDFTLQVRNPQGNPVSGFRYLLEEDTTYEVVPGVPVSDPLAVRIHNSYAPVVTSGFVDGDEVVIQASADKRYFVSVLPYADYTISGHSVNRDQNLVQVIVNPHPVPTAQISVLVFEDTFPINNAPDQNEQGLEGFDVKLSDIGGQMMMNAFGHTIGTVYETNPDGTLVLDGDGQPTPIEMGTGVVQTNALGEVLIKYLAPGKYGVVVVPPTSNPEWIQTSTIEGTPTVDAWVKANEPPVFVEFGPASHHVFFGFIKPFDNLAALPGGPHTQVSGRVMFNHFNRPPYVQGFSAGEPVGGAWVGLNSLLGEGLYAAACNEDSTFTIDNVPPGTYQLVTWDRNLDAIFGFNSVTVPASGDPVNLGNVLSFRWFGKLEGRVFLDADQDGFPDDGEMGIPEQNINLRFRDGTIYQAQPTDMMGEYAFEEVFPFFKWLVVEVDFVRHKATGLTSIVDYGGPIPADDGWNMPSRGKLNPQPQAQDNPNTGNNFSRTEMGAVLTQAMHLFLTQVNIIDWGKWLYGPEENGGISGIAFYAVTRAENDPRYAAAEPWEPGIPRVQVCLYNDTNCDGAIDDLNSNGMLDLADVDNYPFGWADGGTKGSEDIKRSNEGAAATWDAGDALNIATTDCWDDNKPTGAIHETLPVVHGVPTEPGFDNFATWNQVRPGVFDGGYAFTSYFPGGMASGSVEVEGLPAGGYIVEATTPSGYKLMTEEDKNVDFGEPWTPSPLLLPPVCVGEMRQVPQYLSLQTYPNGTPLPGIDPADLIESPWAGELRPLPNRKQVLVSTGKNTAADFFFCTIVPKSGQGVGFINNDLSAEFDVTSPIFGEKGAPSWLPISFQDYNGHEINRVYCDEFGAYNARVVSTYSMNLPAPSGVSPQMISFTINHPGPVIDPVNCGQALLDPFFDPEFSQTPYTFNFEPGRTTYLDTPVIPVSAFVGYPNRNLDVEPATGTPVIKTVNGPDGGPIVCNDEDTIVIESVGFKMVANPDYDPDVPGSEPLVQRDFGFGSDTGQVTINNILLTIVEWTNESIIATVDFDMVNTGQLVITRADTSLASELGLTLHVDACANAIHVEPACYPATPIQDAIDAADPGDLIIIEPGNYFENPILYKPLILQGSGTEGTIINANPVPSERVTTWQAKLDALTANGDIPVVDAAAIQGPGILIVGNPGVFNGTACIIDGLTISGAVSGGGLYVYANADGLEIRNSHIRNNQGTNGGGINIGRMAEVVSPNVGIKVYRNWIIKNGGQDGAGGVQVGPGCPMYEITDNLIMGNFTRFSGGGVGHDGLSDNGLIARNRIVANEVFYGGQIGGDGGGIYLQSGFDAEDPGELGTGIGNVTISSNLIQGNLAGSARGGGIAVIGANGQDVATNPGNPEMWYSLNVFNNIVVNNVAAYTGGGIYLADATRVRIVSNTIANNDVSSTAANAFDAGNLLLSNAQPAGLVSSLHNPILAAASGQEYSNPVLENNIINGNRSFYWDATLNGGMGGLAPHATQPIWDLAVHNRLLPSQSLNPDHCLLSSLSDFEGNDYDDGTNVAGSAGFVDAYNNTLLVAAVIDEGGNFITTRFLPIGRHGDYHITPPSAARNSGSTSLADDFTQLQQDYDGDSRPDCLGWDIGADEMIVGIAADLDGNGTINVGDLAMMSDVWLDACPPPMVCCADLNSDGIVNLADFAWLVSAWGQTWWP